MADCGEKIIEQIKKEFGADNERLRAILKGSSFLFGNDPKLQEKNTQDWVDKLCVPAGYDNTIEPGTVLANTIAGNDRTAIVTENFYFQDQQFPFLFFKTPNGWIEFAARTSRKKKPTQGTNFKGWGSIYVAVPRSGVHDYVLGSPFHEPTPSQTSKANAVDSPLPEEIQKDANMQKSPASVEPCLPKEPQYDPKPLLCKRFPLPKVAREQLPPKEVLKTQYAKHMEETPHTITRGVSDTQWWTFWLFWGANCMICTDMIPMHQKEPHKRYGPRCHVISKEHGSPDSCTNDNLMLLCTQCNTYMDSWNALGYILVRRGAAVFVNCCKQLYLLHVEGAPRHVHTLTQSELSGCYDYILARFINYKYGWTESQRALAKEVLHQSLHEEGLADRRSLVNDISKLERDIKKEKTSLKRNEQNLEKKTSQKRKLDDMLNK